MHILTVFTPTYNRVEKLQRTYESLLAQTSRDFEWLVVDDGSTDNTKSVVSQWIKKTKVFPIRYIHKKNGGLHTGYNVAIENISTELCVCCDSDDYLPNDAVETIIMTWKNRPQGNFAGIIGLDYDARSGKPIGGFFSDTSKPMHFLELRKKARHSGDMKMVLRTDLLKPHIPMPTFAKEKNFNPIYLFFKIDPQLNYLLINHNLCNVEYQIAGMSANIYNQFRDSPYSFAELRRVKLLHPKVSVMRKYIDAAHLVSCALFTKDVKILKRTQHSGIIALALPLGLAIHLFIRYKTHKFLSL